jgi:translation initiation factor IF-2
VTEKRPPVVGILGHIDHGKSTLLDYIRKSNVVEKEAGGITQHISAYEVSRTNGQKITFIDTPGHEAFANVRTKGAQAADIAVLIVSGEDGVKPQTLEVFKYIQETSLPYLVAITKMDKPNASLERTKQNLAESGIYVEGYGGDVTAVPVSAKTGDGIEELLDMISLMADVLDLKGEKDALGTGIIIESRLDAKRGIAATGIIKNGTVNKGTFAACGTSLTPLRFLLDAEGQTVEELSFSSPVSLIGWDKLPPIGKEFKTFLKKEDALSYIESNKTSKAEQNSVALGEGVIILPLIIKTDTAGSLEAIENELKKIVRERIVPKVLVAGVGTVNENDVKNAITTPGTVIMSFHAKIDSPALALAERTGVSIMPFSIIYELTAKVAELLAEHEPKVESEVVTGAAKVLKVFSSAKGKQVLGGRVLEGSIAKNAVVKIIRRESELGQGRVKELQQSKISVDSVQEGTEFGAMVESKFEVAPGDVLQCVITVTK